MGEMMLLGCGFVSEFKTLEVIDYTGPLLNLYSFFFFAGL